MKKTWYEKLKLYQKNDIYISMYRLAVTGLSGLGLDCETTSGGEIQEWFHFTSQSLSLQQAELLNQTFHLSAVCGSIRNNISHQTAEHCSLFGFIINLNVTSHTKYIVLAEALSVNSILDSSIVRFIKSFIFLYMDPIICHLAQNITIYQRDRQF